MASKPLRPLGPAKPRKNTTLCETWFFGGPHSWPVGTERCAVVRRQKPPYQHRTTDYHEWGKDGRCVHCRKLPSQVKRKPQPEDRCLNCGKTKAELKNMAVRGEQPQLHCEDFGHTVKRGPRRPHPLLKLVVNNSQRKP